jgi:DNA-binding transcriptional ArsR family regulator
MARGLGRALQTVLAQEGPAEDLEIEGPSLANARRRQVFRYLCLRPCARVGEIGRILGLSHATVRWHERDLLENRYIEVDASHAFPRGLIDPGDAGLFSR